MEGSQSQPYSAFWMEAAQSRRYLGPTTVRVEPLLEFRTIVRRPLKHFLAVKSGHTREMGFSEIHLFPNINNKIVHHSGRWEELNKRHHNNALKTQSGMYMCNTEISFVELTVIKMGKKMSEFRDVNKELYTQYRHSKIVHGRTAWINQRPWCPTDSTVYETTRRQLSSVFLRLKSKKTRLIWHAVNFSA